MNQHIRTFEDKIATRESVPLLIGLMGPSGGGKTFSALRLASGIQQATGGDIFGIDTEARRMTHYADRFKFRHISFGAPFGALDYLEALRYCVKQGGRIIIVDSMSHEHEGPGGLLDYHEKELDRLGGQDYAKRERIKMLAWQKPKAARRTLINGLLQLEANFIFCFRSKQTAKPIKIGGKTEIVNQGFMPIAGDEFVFEQTVNCLLLPAAGGVPTWRSENMGERQMMKLPEQFRDIFTETKPLDEATGCHLAEWAKGSGPAKAPQQQSVDDDFGEETATDRLRKLDDELAGAAERGMEALRTAWNMVPREYREALVEARDRRHKPRAADVDRVSIQNTEPANGHQESGSDAGADGGRLDVGGTTAQIAPGEHSAPTAEHQGKPEAATTPSLFVTPATEMEQSVAAKSLTVAARRGTESARKGHSRKAVPPEYRVDGCEAEAREWVNAHTREVMRISEQ